MPTDVILDDGPKFWPVTMEQFTAFLQERAPDQRCATCGHAEFGVSHDEASGRLWLYQKPGVDGGFTAVTLHACLNCGTTYELLVSVINLWASARSAP